MGGCIVGGEEGRNGRSGVAADDAGGLGTADTEQFCGNELRAGILGDDALLRDRPVVLLPHVEAVCMSLGAFAEHLGHGPSPANTDLHVTRGLHRAGPPVQHDRRVEPALPAAARLPERGDVVVQPVIRREAGDHGQHAVLDGGFAPHPLERACEGFTLNGRCIHAEGSPQRVQIPGHEPVLLALQFFSNPPEVGVEQPAQFTLHALGRVDPDRVAEALERVGVTVRVVDDDRGDPVRVGVQTRVQACGHHEVERAVVLDQVLMETLEDDPNAGPSKPRRKGQILGLVVRDQRDLEPLGKVEHRGHRQVGRLDARRLVDDALLVWQLDGETDPTHPRAGHDLLDLGNRKDRWARQVGVRGAQRREEPRLLLSPSHDEAGRSEDRGLGLLRAVPLDIGVLVPGTDHEDAVGPARLDHPVVQVLDLRPGREACDDHRVAHAGQRW